MNELPLVSALIPCYNHEGYITQCLDSIISDTYANKEIIIINDGSTDDSNNIIKNWISQHENEIYITYKSRENKGLCATLNELLGLSKGKYLFLIASDDALYGNTIKKRVEILEENEIKGKLVLISDALVIDNDSNVILQSSMSEYNKGNKLKYKTDEGIMEEVISNPSISGATNFINRKIFSIIGLYPEDLKAEDWYFYQRAAAEKAMLFWDKPVSLYRVHPANTSGSVASNDKQLGLAKSIIKTYYRNYKKFPFKYKLFSLIQILKFIKHYSVLKIRILFE